MSSQDAVLAAVREILGNPARYGLIWRRLPATVVNAVDVSAVQIVLDGDSTDNPTTAVSLVGGAKSGDRVMVDIVPPSGAYIVGQISSTNFPAYRFLETVAFTTTGLNTLVANDYAGIRAVRQRMVGGGGGGGGAATTAAGQAAVGAGGGGAGYSESFLTIDQIAASTDGWTVTVGTSGAGGAAGNNSGAVGGDSQGGGKTANGGAGGEGGAAAATTVTTQGGNGGNANGDISINGGEGGNGMRNSGFVTCAGWGGPSVLGMVRRCSAGDSGGAGVGGHNFGGGGSGGYLQASQTQVAGGNGAPGVVLWDLFV